MNKTLRNSLIGVAAVVAIVLALPFLVPTSVYRDRIESAASQATGRALHIDGPLRLMLFPCSTARRSPAGKATRTTYGALSRGRS